MYVPKPHERHLLKLCDLFRASKIRGLHAFGYSFSRSALPGADHLNGAEVVTRKARSLEDLLVQLLKHRDDPPSVLIGHNRYSTSGDYHDHANNQPIALGGAALVFNGIVTQATKAEYSALYGKAYTTENDGEIVLRKLLDGDDWAGFVKRGKFSFAGLTLAGGQAVAMRNDRRPMWSGRYGGGVFVASTEDIMWRAGDLTEVKPVPAGRPFRLEELL
jgi:glutamine phosphoribosylpyrophosphate amidotransferase